MSTNPISTNTPGIPSANIGVDGFHRAGSLSAFSASDRLAAAVNGTHVVVFKLAGSFVATPAICPHAGGPLCDATIEGESLSCAWHGYNFSLRTGECDDDPDLHMERYEVRIEGDDVLVKV
jgi:nitrite reductase/ring-hydroxylating ferredoxin subunit